MSCNKAKFTKRSAEAALAQNRKEGHQHNKRQYRHEIRCYCCDECKGAWHLTSMEEYVKPEEVNIKYKNKWKKLLA